MNKIIAVFFATVFLIGNYSFQTQTDNALARASKVNGRLVFYRNEPVSNYEVAFTFKNSIKNFDCNTVGKNMDEAVKNANMESGQQGRLYDGLIIGTSDRDIAITFTDKTKDNSITRVKREAGIFLFLGCEPLSDYTIVRKVEVYAWKSKHGDCPTWQEKIEALLKKTDRKRNACDAVMIGDIKYNNLIKFKQ